MSKYFVGDLCYVLPADLYFPIVCGSTYYEDGMWHTVGGVWFAFAGTEYGDGIYTDQYDHFYPVDAGIIGIVKLENFEPKEGYEGLGKVIESEDLPRVIMKDGKFSIGDIQIDTTGEEEVDDSWEDEEEVEDIWEARITAELAWSQSEEEEQP